MQPSIKKSEPLKVFFLAFFASLFIFIPFILFDNGYFIYYGDYNSQQIPFYLLCHDAVRSGEIFWNFNTDLGANFIGSYSFYTLGSPFFWLTLPFPSSAVPYLMGPLMVLKFSFAALFSYLYIRRFVKNGNNAVIAGLLYAFSGFSLYNIFFNHFHEAIVFFPLLLLALEKAMADNKKGVFAVAVFLSAVSNYFFFFGMVIFLGIYFIFRSFSGEWKFSFSKIIRLGFESVLGVLLSAVLLLPSFFTIIENPRAREFLVGWKGLLYSDVTIYGRVLQSLFFPPDLPGNPVFFPKAANSVSSLALWLPLFGAAGVIAFLRAKKGHWLKRMILTCGLIALVPVLNSSFHLFNANYYARWFYMPVLMLALATALSFEGDEKDFKSGAKWALLITLALVLSIGLFPEQIKKGKLILGLFDHQSASSFFIVSLIAVLSCVVTLVLTSLLKQPHNSFSKVATACVLSVSVIASIFLISTGKAQSDSKNFIIPYAINGREKLKLSSLENYRVDVYQSTDNLPMYWSLPSLASYHSIVPGSVFDFYSYIGADRGAGIAPDSGHQGLRSLLSVRYLFDNDVKRNFGTPGGQYKMQEFKFVETQGLFNLYENQDYIPMGFSYDFYITNSQMSEIRKPDREYVMLEALLVKDSDEALVKNYLKKYDTGNALSAKLRMKENSNNRALESASVFSKNKKGFHAEIKLENETYVFFSIPYEKGWSATVNGEKARILTANQGFMAVKCPKGKAVVEFSFIPKGFKWGGLISLISFLLLAFYLLILTFLKFKKPKPDFYNGFDENTAEIKNHYIDDLDFKTLNSLSEYEEDVLIQDNESGRSKTGAFISNFTGRKAPLKLSQPVEKPYPEAEAPNETENPGNLKSTDLLLNNLVKNGVNILNQKNAPPKPKLEAVRTEEEPEKNTLPEKETVPQETGSDIDTRLYQLFKYERNKNTETDAKNLNPGPFDPPIPAQKAHQPESDELIIIEKSADQNPPSGETLLKRYKSDDPAIEKLLNDFSYVLEKRKINQTKEDDLKQNIDFRREINLLDNEFDRL